MQGSIPACTKTNLSMKNTRIGRGKRERKGKNKFLEKKRRKEREKLRYVFMLVHLRKKKKSASTFSNVHVKRWAGVTVTCILKLEYIQTQYISFADSFSAGTFIRKRWAKSSEISHLSKNIGEYKSTENLKGGRNSVSKWIRLCKTEWRLYKFLIKKGKKKYFPLRVLNMVSNCNTFIWSIMGTSNFKFPISY